MICRTLSSFALQIEYMVDFKCSQMCPNAISVPCSYHIKESKWEDITTLELTEISLTCGGKVENKNDFSNM